MRILGNVVRGLVFVLESVAKTIGAMSGAHTHDLDGQRKLYEQRPDYRP
ncbi:hypothetical protein [Curtobacterium sp. MCPF17_031]|nr:hypothetical protein [Curtobacterium sp. MCPF17_031]